MLKLLGFCSRCSISAWLVLGNYLGPATDLELVASLF
jgi:hypothetical protein